MANESYINKGTKLLFSGTGTGADYAFSVEGLLDGAGQVAQQADLGALPRPAGFEWSCECQWQATPIVWATLDLYVAGAPDHDNTLIDGNVGLIDAALSDTDKRANLKYIGSLTVEEAAAGVVSRASGRFVHTERYLSPVAVNSGGSAIDATAANFKFELTPIYWQGQ